MGGWVDDPIMQLVAAHRSDWATGAARALMWVANSLTALAVVVLLAVVVVVARRAYRQAAAVALAVVTAGAVARLLKELFGRSRPPADLALVHLAGASMPSTHAALTSAAATAVLVATTWTSSRARLLWTLVLAAGTAFVGVCMVYLGGHWPTDVLAGWALGIALGAGAGLLCRRAQGADRRDDRRPDPRDEQPQGS
ncbi:undecaprenyl-diphosphatase [Actinopolymorpha cephalotaxi]|uniref:Undecaprenyl-diphosphatase n=1 Tax=Actinopolymorpha cephalotaxi TaxID=504797 RepID=A0A1I2N6L3_9ACTN|nr:phosphatase PAP2 family protein [Actinopolymorpha cephalotaxi]NYH85684.1 undecaprenyl-diphosphatase [Actinopolymorpha cephalotaxi]SFF98740.1 undecaprenyl-diphosphatase [Actinopolymorpha cephalotaxi]